MYKVYLVEDESVVRDGLRENIPWEQYGFTFAGAASDGEIALPEILRIRPDVLITDIRMPFMDGLSLSRIVRRKLPSIRIIILSGYHDFDYARKAIEIGVERFLTKPVTRRTMTQLLGELSVRLDSERENEDLLQQQREQLWEYEQYRSRRFLEDIFAGRLSVEQIYQESMVRGMDLSGPSYCLMLYDIFSVNEGEEMAAGTQEADLQRCREDVMQFFLRNTEYMIVPWIETSCCVIVKGDPETVELAWRGAQKVISQTVASSDCAMDYLLCVSHTTDRLSGLRECYEKVRKYYTLHYIRPAQRLITEEIYRELLDTASSDQHIPEEEGAKGRAGKEKDGTPLGLQKALEYIDAYFDQESLSLQTAAAYAEVSAGYLSGVFSQKMGMTFIEYVTAKRVSRAKWLLEHTQEPTAQIAAMTGYKDPNYFRSVFKKTEGVTPREYRSRQESRFAMGSEPSSEESMI